MARIYYIRPNHTTKLPANVMILDTETEGVQIGDVELHNMSLAWTWRMHLSASQEVVREAWNEWRDTEALGDYIVGEARSKAPLLVLGSNITFDLFASGLAAYFNALDWQCTILYDKGLTTIIRLELGSKRITFLAVQNFLSGGVAEWGDMLGKPKAEISFEAATLDELSVYCKLDTEITGLAFLEWLRFVEQHDMGGFAHTRASQAFRCWRHRFLKRKVLHYDQDAHNAFARRAYYGGRVEAGLIGTIDGVDMVKLDVNSMYPAVMRSEVYPTRLKQWMREPTIEQTLAQLGRYCCIAEVELDTDEPAYPLRGRGKLLFPLGRFVAHLSTPSLSYALAQGHVVKVRQLMTFSYARLFPEFVDEWYGKRVKYKNEGNAIHAQICKLLLNSLYGKFGELREKVISEGDDPDRGFYRTDVSVPTELVYRDHDADDWHYDPTDWPTEEHVVGTEWSAWGRYQVSAGQEEGPYSMPPIAAHVTDYGRMLLYRAMKAVGLDRVLYCDTDSLIIRAEDIASLADQLDETRLGALKIEQRSSYLEVRGAKDYTFGDSVRRKGVRSSAVEIDPGVFEQPAFPGLYSLMRAGQLDGFPIGTITRQKRTEYDKGKILDSGRVVPWIYHTDKELTSD